MIKLRSQGSLNKTMVFLENAKKPINRSTLNRYGQIGVDALRAATPVDTGKTADSWYYTVKNESGMLTISFNNSNIQNGYPIAIILDYGHGTGTGGWVEGRDYIDPSIRPVFDDLLETVWREVGSP